jgi:hypothetical protein
VGFSPRRGTFAQAGCPMPVRKREPRGVLAGFA